jgi:hypothetical protein
LPDDVTTAPLVRVWIAQCLCPQRHCIMAAAGEAATREEAEERLGQPLREQVEELLEAKAINPWCAICGSTEWRIDLGRTAFLTLDEAKPSLVETAQANDAANALYGDLHRRGKPN